jgi:hypothetical protein
VGKPQLKTVSFHVAPSQAADMKTWGKFTKSSKVRQCTTSEMADRLGSRMENSREFKGATWTCGLYPQSLCLGCSPTRRSSCLSLKVTLYSPDMASHDFFLFPRMKSQLWWHRSQYVPKIQEHSPKILQAVPKCQIWRCIYQWNTWWTSCITSKGVYFNRTPTTDSNGKCIFCCRLSPVTFQ